MRKFWRNVHLWIGLTAGTLLVLIGLTGSLLVFYRTLEEQIYPDMLLTQGSGEAITLTQALERAQQAFPDGTVFAALPPRHEHATYIAYRWQVPAEGDPIFSYVSIDPYTGQFLGERVFGKTVMTFIYDLHFRLTMGEAGKLVVGFIGLFFLLTLFIGLYLWWPKQGKWKQGLTFKKHASTHRRNVDIHRVFGIYPYVLLLMIGFSGVYMIFPEQVAWGVEQVSTLEPDIEHETKIQAQAGATPLPYEAVMQIALRYFPLAQLARFDPPHNEEHPVVVSFYDAKQPMKSHGYNQVFIHPFTGEVLYVKAWDKASAGDVFLAWQFPLHNGEVFGLFGRWVIFFSGFLPLILYITGLRMWLRRRKKRVIPQEMTTVATTVTNVQGAT